MTHRGAVGSDARDGDGAGCMTSIPHKFFQKNFEREQGIKLPDIGQYAVGNLFFKPDEATMKEAVGTLEEIAAELDLRVLGYREVPRDSSLLGPLSCSHLSYKSLPTVKTTSPASLLMRSTMLSSLKNHCSSSESVQLTQSACTTGSIFAH